MASSTIHISQSHLLSNDTHFKTPRKQTTQLSVSLKNHTFPSNFSKGSVQITHKMSFKSVVVSATTAEKAKKRYPGEAKGFVEEMRFIAMKLHTKDQAKEGEKESQGQFLMKWEPTIQGYVQFLVDSKVVYDTLETIIHKASYPPCGIQGGSVLPLITQYPTNQNSRFLHGRLRSTLKWRSKVSEPDASSFVSPVDAESTERNAAAGFCIIEGPETVQDFAQMQLQEIQDNIRSRRNKVFLLMEEVRRLRIQQRIRSAELGIVKEEQEIDLPDFPSFIPFLPPLSAANLKQYYAICFSLISGIIIFGGLLAPTLELKLGIGGTSYEDFIRNVHLPMQLSEVDPIVASFSGGAVGVISALMVVEINNVKQQEHKRCKYCLGTGYLSCARCSSTGSLILVEPVATINGGDQPLSPPRTERCSNCSGAGKVMCPTCLCTGMAMASEHDPRIDPFD